MINNVNDSILNALDSRVKPLEKALQSEVIFYYGPIGGWMPQLFRNVLEKLVEKSSIKRLSILLNTTGGSVEVVEQLVNVIRHHYDEIYCVVPDAAYSAGTIFAMSADKIYMDYSSSLGPIDPQVNNGKNQWVPALGYLDKVSELVEKSKNGTLTPAEMMLLKDMDLATLRAYEQAKNLSEKLLIDWLVKYKFKNWTTHRTDKKCQNKEVTEDDKKKRAEKVASRLSDNKLWCSHGRSLNIDKLQNIVKLEIEDYSENTELRQAIRSYNDLMCDFIAKNNYNVFIHSSHKVTR